MIKALSLVSFALPCVAALLQYNDPDPWLWASAYGLAAVVCYRHFRGRPLPLTWVRSLSLAYFLGGVAWFLAHRGEIVRGDGEPLWESLGLVLTGILLGARTLLLSRRVATHAQVPSHR